MSDAEDGVGAAAAPVAPAAEAKKDPLDFNSAVMVEKLTAWAIEPCNSKTVKTRDREEIEFLARLQKYEDNFEAEDRKAYSRGLRHYFIVSDLNWNAALNNKKETLREDVGIIVSV